ncbi:ABC transporter ATP-binding protein, partial [Zunongwangia endophytica]|nr:ABC transporter ATP-binding protein [Zunongwangia endophytica]
NNQRIRELSGGEQRIIEIYLVLREMSLCFWDEPFAQLFFNDRKIFNNNSKRKRTESIIITDHRYEAILDISDDIYLFRINNPES